jgi:hypothetical protein
MCFIHMLFASNFQTGRCITTKAPVIIHSRCSIPGRNGSREVTRTAAHYEGYEGSSETLPAQPTVTAPSLKSRINIITKAGATRAHEVRTLQLTCFMTDVAEVATWHARIFGGE